MDTFKIMHEVEATKELADRIIQDAGGIIVVEDGGRHINCGDYIHITSCDHIIQECIYRIKDTYAGIGMVPGWKALFVKYSHAVDEPEE